MEDIIQFARALADETRVRIIRLVMDEALCVCELADILQMPQSSVSSHIQVIRKAGLLASERCEKWIYYRVHTRFMPLLGTMDDFFKLARTSVLAADARRACARLARRAESCCPGPKTLAEGNKRARRSHEKTAC